MSESIPERKNPESSDLCGGDWNSSRNGHSERGERIKSSLICLFGGYCLCFSLNQELKVICGMNMHMELHA